MWQLESDATNASSGSTFAGFPRYAGAAVAVIVWPPSKLQVWSRGYFWYENSAPPRSHFKLTLCSDMPLDKAARNARQARRLTAHGSLVTFHPRSRDQLSGRAVAAATSRSSVAECSAFAQSTRYSQTR